jgi:hypothetical protein
LSPVAEKLSGKREISSCRKTAVAASGLVLPSVNRERFAPGRANPFRGFESMVTH